MSAICLALALLTPSMGRADQTEPADDKLKVVLIASVSEHESAQAVVDAARAQLSDLPVDLQVEWVEVLTEGLRNQHQVAKEIVKKHRATIAFWVNLSTGNQIFLCISEPGGDRILVRTIGFDQENPESRFEVIAIIIRTAIESLIEGDETGIRAFEMPVPSIPQPSSHTPPVSPSEQPAEPEQPPSSDWFLEIPISYGVTLYDSNMRLIHGGRVGITIVFHEWASIFTAYRIQVPLELKNDLIWMELAPHPFEVGFAAHLYKRRWSFDIGVALLNDPLTWSITSNQETIRIKTRRFRWLVAISPIATIGWSLNRYCKFFTAASADIYFNESPSAVKTSKGIMKMADPWDVRPYLQLGVTFSVR